MGACPTGATVLEDIVSTGGGVGKDTFPQFILPSWSNLSLGSALYIFFKLFPSFFIVLVGLLFDLLVFGVAVVFLPVPFGVTGGRFVLAVVLLPVPFGEPTRFEAEYFFTKVFDSLLLFADI